ncbi:MAG: zinc ABC transporter substrate-binding protein [Candidatus Izimaplasma sp.]|nr:zinc ABC transporter substrate-binding protein [Candidatus Izimaplasma bacterium]
MKKILSVLLIFITLVTLSACNNTSNNEKPVVYTTVYPIKYLVEEIAGDLVEVRRVPGSNVHSESIDWGAQDIIAMNNAIYLFYVGEGLDNYISDNKESTFSDGNVELVKMSSYVELNEICVSDYHDEEEVTHDEETTTESGELVCDSNNIMTDPHFWLDPVRMKEAANIVRDKLISYFPEKRTIFENNYVSLRIMLEKLHDDYEIMAQGAIKPIITTVKLFSYWHARYDIEIISLTSSLHSSDTNPGEIIAFLDIATRKNIHYILFEKYSNSPIGEKLFSELYAIDQTASRKDLHGLGNITKEEQSQAADYISLMYDNLEVLKLATK